MNLNLRTNACDPERLESFLNGEMSDVQEHEFASHLNACENCRCFLEQQAAEPQSWREAQVLLQPAEFDSSHLSEESEPGIVPRTSRQPLLIQAVLDALGPTDDPAMLGRLGGYEVSGVVGAGGMGVVLKAIDKSLDRIVAIKVMAPHLAASGAARKRFAREAKAAAAVLHPNVIAIHSVSNDEALPYLVMPYLRGTSLQKRLDREGPLSLREILRIGSQIAAGLAAAHAQGLVHRDIKPANILLEEGVERVAITDFGLARAVDDATITHSGVIAGTPQYMSPEQARGEAVEQRSDLFSLGSVLYAICTGRPPFRAETTYGVMRRITDDEPTSIREINPEVPDWLCSIIAKLMSKRAGDRFESAAEVTELLVNCLAHVQHPAAVPLPASLVSHTTVRRSIFNSHRKGMIAMLTTIGFILLGTVLSQAPEAPDTTGLTTIAAKVVGASADGKTITLEMPPPENRGEEAKRIEIRITDKTAVSYSGVGLNLAKPTEGYHAQAWLQKGSTDTAVKVSFSVVDSTRQSRLFVSGMVVGVSPDSKKITLELPMGRDQTSTKVDLTLTEKTTIAYAYAVKDGAKPKVGYQADVWLQELASDIAAKVNFVDLENEKKLLVSGKVIRLSDNGFTLEIPTRDQGSKKIDIKITGTTEITFQGVGPDGAKLTEGYSARVWLQEGTTDIASKVLMLVTNERGR